MKLRNLDPVSILLTIATTVCSRTLLLAMKMLEAFLGESTWERISGLTQQFRDILETYLMEATKKLLPASCMARDGEMLLADWEHLSCPAIEKPITSERARRLARRISDLYGVWDYRTQRESILAELNALEDAEERDQVSGILCHKLSDMLFCTVIPAARTCECDPLTMHQFSLWNQANACIAAGAESYAMYFLCCAPEGMVFLSPWTLDSDATVQELYLTARTIGALAQKKIPWNHALLVSDFQELLDAKIRGLLACGGTLDDRDALALLELHAMVGWTGEKYMASFWELDCFRKTVHHYVNQEVTQCCC